MKTVLTALMTILVAASANAAEMNLAGEWQVSGKDISSKVQLPGTLAANHIGRRWTEHDFTVTMDLEQSEALVEEFQYLGPATYVRKVELGGDLVGRELEFFLERVMWKSEVFWDGRSLGECDSLATPHIYRIPRELTTAGTHELQLTVDNSPRYDFSRQSHAYGPNMQAVWNGVLGRIELRERNPLDSVRVFAAADGTLKVDGPEGVSAEVLDRKGPIQPWTPEHPQLYSVRLRLGTFEKIVRIGFRTVGTRGHSITLNGKGFFTRGNIENCNFALNGTPWMTKGEWEAMFRTLKSEDGIDTIRFHSWCPPEAAFAAADEVGLMLQPEAGIWQDGWMKSGAAIGLGKPVDGFVRREMRAIVDAYGNHPSFLSLAIGNELGSSNFEEMGKMMEEVRKHDPRHLYFASTARTVMPTDDMMISHNVQVGKEQISSRCKLFAKTDWDYEELYSKAMVPTVAHEIGQWPVYPLWDELLTPFTGTMRPWNLSRHFDTAKRKNAIRFNEKYNVASAKLSRLIYKEEVESFLRTPSCAGVQLLNVQDYTGQAEALVGWRDPFYQLKRAYADLPPFSTIWGSVAYLARFEKFTWTSGETFRARMQVRNLSDRVLPAGTEFDWQYGDRRGKLMLKSELLPNTLTEVGEVSFVLDCTDKGEKCELRFGTNRWNFWVFPKEDSAVLPAGIVKTADVGEMRAALKSGKTVLYTGTSANSARAEFKPVYWSARWFPVANTTGAKLGTWFDIAHPALAGFPTESFTDWQWYSLSEGEVVHALAPGLPDDFLPIGLSVNDFHFSDFTATMFEVLSGKGRLFVCGYDLDQPTPESKRLRASVLRYLSGAPHPGTVQVSDTWLDAEFNAAKPLDLNAPIYDEKIDWHGRNFKKTIENLPPTTGKVVVDFVLPTDSFTSGRGLFDGRIFDVPFREKKGERYSVVLPVMREDFLDRKLELEINLMTGKELAIERIRIVKDDVL